MRGHCFRSASSELSQVPNRVWVGYGRAGPRFSGWDGCGCPRPCGARIHLCRSICRSSAFPNVLYNLSFIYVYWGFKPSDFKRPANGVLNVKREMDKVRELLLRIEDGPHEIEAEIGSSDDHHLLLLQDVGFIDSRIEEFPILSYGGPSRWMQPRLTWRIRSQEKPLSGRHGGDGHFGRR